MKPGMQRDLMAAYWLLFDELAIEKGDDPPAEKTSGTPAQPPKPNKRNAAPKPARNGRPPRPPR